MALQKTIFLSGKVNNLVFYQRSGAWIARVQPSVVKQSTGTRTRSRNFGVAARAGSAIRSGLLPALPFPKDKKMQNRFSGAIAQWLQQDNPATLPPQTDIPFVSGFDFNESTSLKERWKTPLTVTPATDGTLELHIPAFIPAAAIAAPAYTAEVIITIAACCCRLTDGLAQGSFADTWTIPYTDAPQPAKTIGINVPADAGNLIVTAIALTYIISGGQKETRVAFMPSSVVDARLC